MIRWGMDLAKNSLEFFKENPSVVVFIVFVLGVIFLIKGKSILKFFSKTTPGVHGKNENTTQYNVSDAKGDVALYRDNVTHNHGITDTKHLEGKIDQLIHLQAQALAEKQANPEKALAEKEAVDKGVRDNLNAIHAFIPTLNTSEALEKLENDDRSGAIDIFTALEKQSNRLSAECAFQLGKIAYDDIRWAEALVHFERAYALEPENVEYIYWTAHLYGRLDNYEKALPIYILLLQKAEVEFPNQDNVKLAECYNNLGWVFVKLGEHIKAFPLYQNAIKVYEIIHPKHDHRDLAISYNNLGGLYYELRNYDVALQFYQKAIIILKAAFGSQKNQWFAQTYRRFNTQVTQGGAISCKTW
jgi:tetratricopeptide (TPR) repeat protein